MDFIYKLGAKVNFRDSRAQGIGTVIGYEKDTGSKRIFYIIESDDISEDDIHVVDKFIGDYLPHNQKKIRRYFDDELSLAEGYMNEPINGISSLPSIGYEIYHKDQWCEVVAHVRDKNSSDPLKIVVKYPGGWSASTFHSTRRYDVINGSVSGGSTYNLLSDYAGKSLRPGRGGSVNGGESMKYDSSVTMSMGGNNLHESPVILSKVNKVSKITIVDYGF